MRKLLLVSVSSLIIGLGAGAVATASVKQPALQGENFHLMELFAQVLDTVREQYVVPVDDKKLIESALNGMLSSLDPHSNYLNAQDFKELRETAKGAYGGLGLEVTTEEGAIKVITPMDDTPAFKAGIQAGDYITAIDGQSVIGQQLSDAVKQMKGVPGTDVTVTVVREGKDPFDLKITREIINVKSVKARVEGDYGVIRITNFNENTGRETEEAIAKLEKDQPKIKGFVIDLRNNPGGILDQSVQVADAFLDGGVVVEQRGRAKSDREVYFAKKGDLTHGLPIVVLVNPGSASAAEIVAGALQDRKRAVILGVTSFGKGSVQSVIPLGNGQDGALKLTTARYYTPSGRSIQKTGIEPDLEVAQTKDQAERLADSKYQFSEASFKNALNADEGKVRRAPHAPAEAPPTGFDIKKGDFQMSRAFDLLAVGGDVTKIKKLPVETTVAAVDPAKGPGAPAVVKKQK